MNLSFIKISAALLILLASGMLSCVWADSKLSGMAELAYIKYDAAAEGKEIASGSTFAQRYDISYRTTNLRYKSQARYYDLRFGYDWLNFNTKDTGPNSEVNSRQSFGKFNYNGQVGYNAAELPISIRAYINDDQPLTYKFTENSGGLINDGLIYDISGRGKSVSSGVYFLFEPRLARNIPLQGLPRLMLDYRETTNNSTVGLYKIHNKAKELAVAGLNQENNWIHYRVLDYVNYLNPQDRFNRQQVQIGLVDNAGRRKWSNLTNWIEVSADGQLTNTKSPASDRTLEEFDVNFMATATRKTWEARTFLNYNRQLDNDSLVEGARVPVYIKGVYGSDTKWYTSLNATRGRELLLATKTSGDSYHNRITAGATTFNRSSFTLSPSINLQTSKSAFGLDTYLAEANLESSSTRRFSDKSSLAGRISMRTMDSGGNSADSSSWSGFVDLNGRFNQNNKIILTLQERAESGSGSGFLAVERLSNSNGPIFNTATNGQVGNYLRNYVRSEVRWMPTAQITTSLDVSYDYVKPAGLQESTGINIFYQAFYSNNKSYYRIDTQYQQKNTGSGPTYYAWKSNAEVQYRPDRYNDGLLRARHEREHDVNLDTGKLEVLQRYDYNFFTRSGVMRNIAKVSEEYNYTGTTNGSVRVYSQSIMLSGRYSPTERLSLYGSAKYETGSSGVNVIYYSAGLSADFRLLATSLNYAYAKRDTDNRIEKRLYASVSRTF